MSGDEETCCELDAEIECLDIAIGQIGIGDEAGAWASSGGLYEAVSQWRGESLRMDVG